jgi:hypothetical protein
MPACLLYSSLIVHPLSLKLSFIPYSFPVVCRRPALLACQLTTWVSCLKIDRGQKPSGGKQPL